jgi:PAS domain S-box-containing protein
MKGGQGGSCVSETIRVLIVEDLPTDAELTEREVRKALVSCEFRRVETREAYLAALDEFRPALIVSDYRLPFFDGMTALKLAVQRCPEVPFVVLTGSMNEDTAVECMKAGAWDYVIKEHVKRLGPAVQSALERQRVRMGRKRDEAALRAALARQEALLAAIPDIVMEVDVNKVYIWANQPGIQFFGSDVVGREAAFYFEGEQDTYGRVQPLFQGNEQTFYVESWQRRRDGEKRLLAWWCRVLKDEAGNATGALSTAHDITERKRAEEALRDSEARFRDTFEHSTIGNSLTALDGRLLNVNQAFADMLGFSIEELQQVTFDEITHPDDIVEGRECVRSLFAGERTAHRMEKRYIHRDGHIVFADLGVSLLRDAKGAPVCLITSVVDISARKRAEEELRFRNVVLATQQETAIDGILVVDAKGKIVSSNRHFAEMWGVPADIMAFGSDERALQSVTDKLVDPAGFISKVRHVYANREDNSQDEIALKYGRTFDRYSAPMLGADGKYFGRVWYFRDITERRRIEAALATSHGDLEQRVAERTAELLVSNQELESFAYAVSHDLRTPLRGIDGWSQAVLEDCGAQLDERGRTYLKRVRSETQRMGELIDGLLDLSRVTRAPMRHETVDLTAMAQELEASLRNSQPERAVDFVVAPGMVAAGDAVLLRATLQNLLGNAWKFTGKRPRARIEVGCTSEQGRTVYHVRDDGAGFDMRFAGKLFAPFQRLHSLAEFPGTGIGLATVQRIIHRHGGKVWGTAEVDRGATFYFTLAA